VFRNVLKRKKRIRLANKSLFLPIERESFNIVLLGIFSGCDHAKQDFTKKNPILCAFSSMDSLIIIDRQGTIIIEKHWKQKQPTYFIIKSFLRNQRTNKINDTIFFTVRYNDIFFIALIGNKQEYPLVVCYQLELLVEIFLEYFGTLNEKTLSENFSTVYQLLEEWIDYGSLYITEPAILKQLVPPPSMLSNILQISSLKPTGIPTRMVSQCPWRQAGIKYAHNEIFFDISESIDCIMDKYNLI
jgi:AP-3 complex subunit mu